MKHALPQSRLAWRSRAAPRKQVLLCQGLLHGVRQTRSVGREHNGTNWTPSVQSIVRAR